MKKVLLTALAMLLMSNIAMAKTDLTTPKILLTKMGITKLDKGEAFKYPLPEGAILQCYAKRIDGSIDQFEAYNDYFVMRNGKLYSNTMHKAYKPNKVHKLKKVDKASMLNDGITLKLYDPLWQLPLRRHLRTIKINTQTGEYYMKGTQDNYMWYRNIVSSGYCRVME